jgi:hypothetical protein
MSTLSSVCLHVAWALQLSHLAVYCPLREVERIVSSSATQTLLVEAVSDGCVAHH